MLLHEQLLRSATVIDPSRLQLKYTSREIWPYPIIKATTLIQPIFFGPLMTLLIGFHFLTKTWQLCCNLKQQETLLHSPPQNLIFKSPCHINTTSEWGKKKLLCHCYHISSMQSETSSPNTLERPTTIFTSEERHLRVNGHVASKISMTADYYLRRKLKKKK